MATLAVRNRSSSRVLLFDENVRLCGWQNLKTEEFKFPALFGDSTAHFYNSKSDIFDASTHQTIKNTHPLAFSGYQILKNSIFEHCTRSGIFSMTDWYIDICAKQKITGYIHNSDYWIDIGSPEQLEKANQQYLSNQN